MTCASFGLGSREPSPVVSALPGFDPSRVFEAMRRYLDAAKVAGVTPVSWHISDPLAIDLSLDEARPAILFGLPVCIHDEWQWGWMMMAKPRLYDFDSHARFWSPPCDSDGSGEAGETEGLDPKGESAGRNGIARKDAA